VDKGYFNNGFNGQGYDPAWQDFGKGNGVFLITGSWLTADLKKALTGEGLPLMRCFGAGALGSGVVGVSGSTSPTPSIRIRRRFFALAS
jgi:raffinose/stachyose/melibiose transport system substrate-binding protein